MKILYLLSALFFLLLLGAPGSSEARKSRKQCRHIGGVCVNGPCRENYKFIGICSRRYSCCQLKYFD